MDDLNGALQRERELLDQLRFRFVEAHLLLAARETRYLAFATEEIDQARARAREADLLRAAHVQRMGVSAGCRSTPTLREVAASVKRPWAGMLRDHHEGLCAIVSEIEVIGHRNAELARAGMHDLARRSGPSLFEGWLGQAVDGPDGAEGRAAPTIILDPVEQVEAPMDHAGELADEHSYQDAIATATRLQMPALLAFLR